MNSLININNNEYILDSVIRKDIRNINFYNSLPWIFLYIPRFSIFILLFAHMFIFNFCYNKFEEFTYYMLYNFNINNNKYELK